MKRAFLVIILLATLVVACAKPETPPQPLPSPSTQDQPAAQQPTPSAPPQPPQGGEGTQGVVTGADKTFGTVNKTSALKIDDVVCDAGKREISFRFRNDDNRTWNLGNDYGWSEPGVPKEKVNIQVEINSYQANSQKQPMDSLSKQLLFGPKWPFIDNCGGVKELQPGDDVTCTLQPVPLKSSTGLTEGLNEIFIKTPTSKHIIQFKCE